MINFAALFEHPKFIELLNYNAKVINKQIATASQKHYVFRNIDDFLKIEEQNDKKITIILEEISKLFFPTEMKIVEFNTTIFAVHLERQIEMAVLDNLLKKKESKKNFLEIVAHLANLKSQLLIIKQLELKFPNLKKDSNIDELINTMTSS